MLFSVMSPQWPRMVVQGWAGGRRPGADGCVHGWSRLPTLPASCLPALCPAVHASAPAAQGAITANRKAPQYPLSHCFRLRGVSSVSTNLFATLGLCRFVLLPGLLLQCIQVIIRRRTCTYRLCQRFAEMEDLHPSPTQAI